MSMRPSRAAILAPSLAAALLAGGAAALATSAGIARPHAAGAQATGAVEAESPAPPARTPPLVREGPGGRSTLAAWVLRADPSDRGLSLGWQRGGFSGRPASVPNVVSSACERQGGRAQLQGLDRVVSHELHRERPGRVRAALRVRELPGERVDRRAFGRRPTTARTCRSKRSATASRRAPTRWSCASTGATPAAQAREGFHRTWFNWGGLNGEVSVRALGASELSDPTAQSTLSPDTPSASSATVRLGVLVRNNGPERTIAPTGTLTRGSLTIPVEFGPLALGHGETGTASATVRVAEPALWSPASPSLYELQIEVGGESSYTAHVGLRELSWRAGVLYLNGRRLRAARRHDPGGRSGTRRRAHAGRRGRDSWPSSRRSARTPCARSIRSIRRCSNGSTRPGSWCGRASARSKARATGTPTRRRCSPKPSGRRATRPPRRRCTPRSSRGTSSTRSPGNGHDGSEVRYVQALGRWLHAHDCRPSWSRSTCGASTRPRTRARSTREVDAVAETDYTGWYDHPRASPARLRALMRERLAAMQRTFPGKGAPDQRVRSRIEHAQPRRRPRQLRLPVAPARSAHRGLRARSGGSAACSSGCCATTRSPRSSGAARSTAVLPGVRLIEGLNQKGLFTYSGRAKPAAAAVRRLFAGLGD